MIPWWLNNQRKHAEVILWWWFPDEFWGSKMLVCHSKDPNDMNSSSWRYIMPNYVASITSLLAIIDVLPILIKHCMLFSLFIILVMNQMPALNSTVLFYTQPWPKIRQWYHTKRKECLHSTHSCDKYKVVLQDSNGRPFINFEYIETQYFYAAGLHFISIDLSINLFYVVYWYFRLL